MLYEFTISGRINLQVKVFTAHEQDQYAGKNKQTNKQTSCGLLDNVYCGGMRISVNKIYTGYDLCIEYSSIQVKYSLIVYKLFQF